MIFPGLADLSDHAMLVLRVIVGVIFVIHGWPKLTGARGMAQAFGRPSPGVIAFFTAQGLVETAGGVAMALGVVTQLAAIAFVVIMIGATALKNTMMKTGFMAQQTTGWEFDLALLGANLVILTHGPGRFALFA